MIEFGTKLGDSLALRVGERRTIVCNQLSDSTLELKKDSHLTLILLLNKGWNDTPKLEFNLTGENSSLTFLAIIVGKHQEQFRFATISRHLAQNTKAHFYLRTALFDKSMVEYKGNLFVDKFSQLTDAYLSHHTLLLSEKAKVKTIPSMEILADNVKAGHAATIGKIDDDILFYLASRGIDKEMATPMITEGFLKKDLNKIQNPDTKLSVLETIENYLINKC